MSRLWQGIVAWVDEKEPVTWLAVFRIAIGLIIVAVLVDGWASGALDLLWVPASEGGLERISGNWRVELLGGATADLAWGLSLTAIVGGLAIALGFGTRVAALITGQVLLALFSLAPSTGGGHDRLITNALWLLVLAPSDASWSVWCRLRTGRFVDPTPRAAWPRYLIAWQLIVMYTITGWNKLGPEWWPWGGLDAVYRSLLHPSFAKGDWTFIAHVFPVTQLFSMATVLWEGAFPLLLLWWWAQRRGWGFGRWPVRAALLGLGLFMHGTLYGMLDLGPFPFVTLAYYAGCFGQADWEAAGTRLREITARWRPAANDEGDTLAVGVPGG